MAGVNGARNDQSAYTKVDEVRKKIALVEGKRRAMFSAVEREKKKNRELTSKLDDGLLVGKIMYYIMNYICTYLRNQRKSLWIAILLRKVI